MDMMVLVGTQAEILKKSNNNNNNKITAKEGELP